MSNALTDARDELAAALTGAGLSAFSVVPESVTPPCVFVGPGAPYLDYEGATFGGVIVHLQAVVVASAGANEVTAGELDQMVLTVLAADLGEFVVEQVQQPGRITLNNQTHLGVAIDVACERRLNGAGA